MGPDDKERLIAIAEAAAPAGRYVPEPDARMVREVETIVTEFAGNEAFSTYLKFVRTLDLAGIAAGGRPLSKMEFMERERAIGTLNEGLATNWLVRLVTAPIKIARFRSPALAEHLGISPVRGLPLASERHRWAEQMIDARTLTTDEEIEVDAVVVGTGAGGAPVAHSLAKKGHAVVMLEEGGYFSRSDFARPLPQLQRMLFRNSGATATFGNTVIPVPLGKTVGGTTTVNSGTCYRVPASVQRRWELEEGLRDLRPGTLDKYFERAEAMLEVSEAEEHTLGGSAHVVRRGCEALGYAHAALHRNATGCDAQGVCCYGCPTDAKRSTNVSYVPKALDAGAMLYHHAEVTRVLVKDGRAVGVSARVRREDGRIVRLTVRASVVVLACGSLHTPGLLLKNGLANSSGQVGHGLTIHPTGYALALLDHPVRGWEGIPQGYAIEEFADQGIRFEGAFMPPELAAATLNHVGARWTEIMENFDHIAMFGFMLADTGRGRVELGVSGEPRMRYDLTVADRERLVRAQGILARVYLAAGAREVYPGLALYEVLRSEADIRRMEREAVGRLKPNQYDVSAYHPLGTCRMGTDPKRSVVGPDHQTHDIRALYITDGSVVPGPLGVNPQMTIMAFAERGADIIDQRLTTTGAISVPAPHAVTPEIEFKETMAGTCRMLDGEPREQSLLFHVAASATEMSDAVSTGGTLALSGELFLEGIASHVPCRGTLLIRPLSTRSTLTYDLAFRADDGRQLLLHGEKHVSPMDPVAGMTTLYTSVSTADGVELAQGVLRFDLRDVGPWLRSFKFFRQKSA